MAAAAKPAPSGNIVEDLFNKAYEVNEEQEALNTRRNGTRNALRSLRDSGVLSAEQVAEVEDLYPTVERKRKPKDDASENGAGE